MCEKSAPYFPVSRLFGRSDFGDYFGCVYDAASNYIHEVFYLGSDLMCNDATACGGRMYLNIFVGDISERWKSLESEAAMMF